MNMIRSIRSTGARIVVAVGAVVAIIACGGSTEPKSPVTGEWDLALINGQALPTRYMIYGTFGRSYRDAISGSLAFVGGSRVIDERLVTDQPQGSPVPEEIHFLDTTSYRVVGDMVIIQRPAISGQQLPAHADTGRLDGDVLVMPVRTVEGIVPAERTLTYVRR